MCQSANPVLFYHDSHLKKKIKEKKKKTKQKDKNKQTELPYSKITVIYFNVGLYFKVNHLMEKTITKFAVLESLGDLYALFNSVM